jgi:hypothetical protein
VASKRLAKRRRRTKIENGAVVPVTTNGRPPAIADAFTRKRLLHAATLGNFQEDCARYAGIDPRTLFETLQRGEEAEQAIGRGEDPGPTERLFALFAREFKHAKAEAKVRTLSRITQAAEGLGPYRGNPQWTAAAWILERMHPDQFARRTVTEVGNKDGKAFAIADAVGTMPDEAIRREIVEVLAAMARDEEDEAVEPTKALPS